MAGDEQHGRFRDEPLEEPDDVSVDFTVVSGGVAPLRKWIEPAQSGEAGEITICRAQRQSMLQCQCGQMRIGNKVAMHSG